jgi:hypothetical protein
VTIRQPIAPTWGEIKNLIEMEHRIAPLDLVVVDYLGLVSTTSRDKSGEMAEIIKDAKLLTNTFDCGRGLPFLTPVQGSRSGFEDATENEGRWDTSGIWMHSEYDRSLNGCMYIFMDDEMKASQVAKIGTCKSRDSADVPPTIVSVERFSGMVHDISCGVRVNGDLHFQSPRDGF